jgi:hypothetical protein
MNPLVKSSIGPIIRHGLTVLSGYFVAQGMPGLTDGTVSNLGDVAVAGVTLLIALGWSIAEKLMRKPQA